MPLAAPTETPASGTSMQTGLPATRSSERAPARPSERPPTPAERRGGNTGVHASAVVSARVGAPDHPDLVRVEEDATVTNAVAIGDYAYDGQATVDVAAGIDRALEDDLHDPVVPPPAPAEAGWRQGLSARVAAAMQDDFSEDTPVRDPAHGHVSARHQAAVVDSTRLTPLDQIEELTARARGDSPALEVEADDVEAAIDTFPRAGSAGPPPATRRGRTNDPRRNG